LDKEIHKAGLEGKKILKCKAEKQITGVIKKLESILKSKNKMQP
jgi:hypothetical protein